MMRLPGPRKGAFSLGSKVWAFLNSPVVLENILRTRGIITDEYCTIRDANVRRYVIGGLSLTRELKSYRHIVMPRTQPIEVYRPGVKLRFRGFDDLFRNLDKLAAHPGYHKYPNAPWLVTNERGGCHKFLPAERIDGVLKAKRSLYIPLLEAA